MEIKKKVVKGAAWNIISQIIVQLLSLGVMIVLARLLNPSEFGIVALSNVCLGFAYLFADLGMGAAVIQRQNIDDDFLSTAFWVTIMTGVGIALLLFLASPFIARFYGENILQNIIILSSVCFLLGPLTTIHISMLTKKLEFHKIAFINITSKVASGIASISIALIGLGVWSLVFGALIGQALVIPVVWFIERWRPRLVFHRRCFADMFSFSSNLLAFNVFNYFARNFDNLLIGKVLGAQTLGYYTLAQSLMLKPLQYISWAIGNALFPAFSSIQDDRERVRSAYIKVIRSISLITFPMMAGLLVVSGEFILVFYGNKWEPIIIPLQLLCIVGAIQSIGTTVGTIFTSMGRSDLLLKWGVFASALCVMAFLIGIQWGLLGLILMYMAVAMLLWPLSHYIANRLINLDMKTFFKTMLPAATASLLMALTLLILKYINIQTLNLNISFMLIVLIILGVLTYAFFILALFEIPEIKEVKRFLYGKYANNIKAMINIISVNRK